MSTSYSNFGGNGNRAAYIGTSTTVTISTGSISYLVGGGYATGNLQWTAQTNTGKIIQFNFTSLNNGTQSVVIDQALWYQSGTTGHGNWQWNGSNDGVTWTAIGSPFTLGGATTQTITALTGNTTSYGYYQMVGTGGTTDNTVYLEGIDFQISGFTIVYIPFFPPSGFVPSSLSVTTTPVIWSPSSANYQGLNTVLSYSETATNHTSLQSGAVVSISTEPGISLSGNPVPVAQVLQNATQGVSYTETISAQGGTPPYVSYLITIGTLPPGLGLNTSTGVISGTPSTTGTYNFTIQVTDNLSATGTQPFTITVAAPAASNFGYFN